MATDKGKRAYRYRITDSTGTGTRAIGDGTHILEWRYYGKQYTWEIFDSTVGDVTGTYTGELTDKGYLVDGKFEADGPRVTA